jgi:pyruvate formate lyase activating enzyme
MIFNIQRFSIHDGAGIRTNIFFKGCPLKCMWCSNPESQSFSPEIMFDDLRCQRFGDCVKTGDGAFSLRNNHLAINRAAISNTHLYDEICPAKALSVVGYEKNVPQVIKEIEKDFHFYRQSGGGITLTGGEPFAQGEDLWDLILALNEKKVPVAVETCLHLPWEEIKPFIPFISEFLIDLKHVDAKKFRTFTGGDVNLVLGNLRQLDSSQASYRLRIPVIPGFNHSLAEMQRIIDFADTLKNCQYIDLIPYHSLGKNKYKMLGKPYPFEGIPSAQNRELEPYRHYAEKKGYQVKIGG